ncbi:probable N-acetyltransferase CML1 [Dromiciops gliroides]|uniref:probable N-acetyltransferase CML1 n=1 Tax=Dromiciops gliroides TaxID=33562 RepID=UPI001CC6F8FA|nr:probable N-acetyltransferase CML1 [Dromiciops gliroides]XP_043838395.1 probable N-acetyltransferase CML1 [Dromiciops gliroides]XP_043838396.1 probable N-acetyltransferase CML1 [Dromiciops gliroides]XP_043838397.1 probable N-acetyltransferase CML1 [Dromiciops gliroides]XP_043838398.1 probable N-acetyltransferase CML1 [Dromiciops gliroides]XP_043838400.1 probable N-acetyltransferase CML1 [Dromiciops gliroides]XP_043838401.1 probable N-acetyltransferase CML1 [Dromiciops gliroides]
MAPYHIRKYQDQDREAVIDMFIKGTLYLVSFGFFHQLKQPRSFLLLLGGPGALFLGSGSLLLSLLALPGLLAFLWLVARYPIKNYLDHALRTDMSDIRKFYLNDRGSCFWVAEKEGQVVGMVCACPQKMAPGGQKRLELLHLSVRQEHRGQGMAKSLTQTVLQFAQDQGYDAVVLSTLSFNNAAQRVYEQLGFWKAREAFDSLKWRVTGMTFFYYEYSVPSSH